MIATGTCVVDEGLASNPMRTHVLRLPFSLPDLGDFSVESVVVASHGNASLAVRRVTDPAETLFLAGWRSQPGLDPYFGVRVAGIGTIHIFLRAGPSP